MNNQIIEFANNLKQQLKSNLDTQMKIDLLELKSDKEELSEKEIEESIENIERYHEHHIFKLSKIDDLIKANDIKALQQIQTIYQIVMSSDVDSYQKDASLTTLIYLSSISDLYVSSLSIEEAYLFCNAVVTLPTEGFHPHVKVVGTKSVLDSVLSKTSVLDQQLDIMWEVLDYCSENTNNDMNEEEYMNAVNDSLIIIASYDISKNDEDIQSK